MQWYLLGEVAAEYLPNIKFCQVLSGYSVAEIRHTELVNYSKRHKSYRFCWTSKSQKAFNTHTWPPDQVLCSNSVLDEWNKNKIENGIFNTFCTIQTVCYINPH